MEKKSLYHNRLAQWIAYGGFFLVLFIIPLFADNPFTLNQFARYCVLATLAVSVSMIWGYGGILSLGQGIAFGLAAYGMGMTMQLQFQDPEFNRIPSFMLTNELESLPLYWEPFWNTGLGIFLALLVPSLFFALFGAMMFQARIAGVFVAIMTLAMLAAWYSMAYDMQPFTGGFNGISPPLPLQIFGGEVDPYSAKAYWICVAVLCVLTLVSKLLMQSRFGLVIQAIRDDAERARFLGYNVAYYQIVLFTISGFIAACGGILWVMVVQFVSPTSLEIALSISAVVWAAVGGRLSFLGAIIGCFLVNGIQSYLGDALQDVWMIILGGLFIIIVLFLPTGLIGLVSQALGRLSGQSKSDGATGVAGQREQAQ